MGKFKPHDFYFKKAKKQKYLARSVYKLEEIQKKYRILKPGARVLDLGCAPGSWLQYAQEKVGPKGVVVGVDQKELKADFGPKVFFVKEDVYELELSKLKQYVPYFDVVLSDMAPATTGIGFVDSTRSVYLAERALEIARAVLKKGGFFLCKVFEGEDFPPFLKRYREAFERVKIIKPKASRKDSREIYLLGIGKKGQPSWKKEEVSPCQDIQNGAL